MRHAEPCGLCALADERRGHEELRRESIRLPFESWRAPKLGCCGANVLGTAEARVLAGAGGVKAPMPELVRDRKARASFAPRCLHCVDPDPPVARQKESR